MIFNERQKSHYDLSMIYYIGKNNLRDRENISLSPFIFRLQFYNIIRPKIKTDNMSKIWLLILLFPLVLGCKKHSQNANADCKEKVIIDADLFAGISTDQFVIKSVSLSGNCIHITIQSGGCSGTTWQATLVDASSIAKSNPPQRMIKLTLKNTEPCEALPVRTFSFDISQLQLPYTNLIQLNLDGYNQKLLYAY